MKQDNYRLGLVSVSFRKHTPNEILEAVKASGLSCIEWGSDVHAPCRDTQRLSQLAKLQKEHGIVCSSYGTYFRFLETPIEELGDYIAAAKILGTDILRLWCGTKSGAEMTEEEKQTLLAQCKEAARIAQAEGVTLCMECHRNTFTERMEDALWLMEAVGSPHLRMYWQPFQWQSIEENLAHAKRIAPYSRHLHVFQWKGSERFSLQEGIDEWRAYLSCFETPRILLLEFMPDDRIESLGCEVKTIKTIIGE